MSGRGGEAGRKTASFGTAGTGLVNFSTILSSDVTQALRSAISNWPSLISYQYS